MIIFSQPLLLLLLLPLAAAAVLSWRRGYVNLGPRRRVVALALRLLLLALIVLALADPQLRLPQSRQAVVFVADRSASDLAAQTQMQDFIQAAVAGRPAQNAAGVVSTGRQAEVEQPVSALSRFDGFQTAVDADYTNLEGGLELASAILPDGYRKRVVLLTDGQENVGDALSAARLLRSEGVRLDVVPAQVKAGPDVLVDRVDVPSQLRPRESFSLAVTLQSNVRTTAGLDVYRDNTLVASRQENIYPGQSQVTLSQSPLTPGFHTYRVQITPVVDSQPNNNSGSAFVSVSGPPRVLVISDSRAKAANVRASLRTTGIEASFAPPNRVVPTLGYLQRYAAVVIVDTAADVLGPDLVAQLVPYVRDLGHGLVVTGGQESYGMGGYGQTALEQALPVSMDLPKRKDLPSAAVVLIIESLEAQEQVNISKQAGKGIVDLLTERDQIAVNDAPFDGSSGWVVSLQPARNKRAIDQAIDQMQPGDPMSYAPELQAAYDALKKVHARVKHIIVLGDGDAEDPSYEALAKKIRAGGITISTVATNGLGFADFQTMQNLARWGGGRYYRADNASTIPQIFLREARTVARSGIITGKFYPQQLSANPMLKDLTAVAPLYGYVATTPKPTGELVLVSKKLDPVLAGWQFGLGRSVAWTSDAAGLWTGDWLRAPGGNRFWADLVSWTLPAGQGGSLFVDATTAQGQGKLAVDVPANLGANPTVTARVVGPDSRASTISLQATAPERFSGAFDAKAQGAYFVTVGARGAGHAAAGQVGIAVPYSAEYRTSGTNLPFLRTLAAAGGGSILAGPSAAWADNLATVYDDRSIQDLLVILALLLLPIDVAARRLVMDRRDLTALRAALSFGRHAAPAAAEPVVAPLGALRQRRSTPRATTRQPSEHPAPAPTAGGVRLASPLKQPRPTPPGHAELRPGPSSEAQTDDGTTAGRLLASKRRRK